MKTKLIGSVACAVLALVAAGRWYARSQPGAQASASPAARLTGAPLGVDDLMRNVDQHRGPVSVAGVVSGASAAEQMLVLIDAKEFADCGTTTCATLALPIRWTGAMPQVSQTVQVDGQVQEVAGKLVFVASAVGPVAQAAR